MKEHLFNFHDVIVMMTMCQCLLLAVFQGLLPAQNRLSQSLLILFFVLTFLAAGGTLFLWNALMQGFNLHKGLLIPIAISISALLKGPVLYFYLVSICETSFRFKSRHLPHLVPVSLALVFIIVFGISGDDLLGVHEEPKESVVLWLWHSIKGLPVAYAILSAFTIRNVESTLMSHYSNENEIGSMWAYVLVIGYFFHWAWSLVTHVIGINFSESFADAMGILDNYLGFVMVSLIFTYELLYARRLVAITAKPVDIDKETKTSRPTPTAEPQDKEPSQEAVQKVKNGIEEKLYLEQNITVEQFAHRIGLSGRETSLVINTCFDANFFEFINTLRVKEAKALLISIENKEKTVLEILYESGFNSKSAFHRYFKRITGVSPTEYRTKHFQNSTA